MNPLVAALRRLAVTLSLLASALSCRGAPAKVSEPAAAGVLAYYPLSVGNRWTYDLCGQGEERQETIQIVGQDGAWFLDDHRGRLRYESDGVRDPDRYLLRSPVESGGKWTAVENLIVQRFEITSAAKSAVTQAGTFTGCAVVRNEQPLPKGARFITEWTYAPKVGLVELRTATLSWPSLVAANARKASAIWSRSSVPPVAA